MELESRAEILKLARVLGTEPERFGYLETVDPAELRVLRDRVTDVMFSANLGVLQRMAGASKLVPAPVLAKIAERTFGPLLCARIAGLVEPARGVEVAKRLSPGFLADVAVELDPRRASRIIGEIPGPTITAVARELVRREDWITIGRFVGHLSDDKVSASLEVIHDAGLLQIAFVLENKDRVDDVLALLPTRRLDGVMRAAAEADLWPAAFDLLPRVSDARRERLLRSLERLPADQRAKASAHARALGVALPGEGDDSSHLGA